MNLLKFLLITLGVTLLGTTYAAANDYTTVKTMSDRISDDFSNIFSETTGFVSLEKNIQDLFKTTTSKDQSMISEEIIQDLRTLLNERLSTVMNLATNAENVYQNYNKDSHKKLDKDTFDFFDGTKVNDSTLVGVHKEFSDKLNVTLEKSIVQIPTDVYKYDEAILKSINWTKALDKKFQETLNKTKTKYKTWQYIGLSDGVFRTYPGSLWQNASEELKYFDCRQRGWYIEGSSSPKDMVIVLDMSGSVIGNRLLIIKLAVMSLLDTLQVNDFVNIIYFNKDAHCLKPCLERLGLVQATARNKKILKAAIQSSAIEGKDTANVEAGFELAFTILKDSRGNISKTSNCTQTIAFFTDGVEGDTVAEDVFRKFNHDKHVRVFTYLVGRDKGSPFKAVEWIACQNKGYFYRIETLSDVRENIVKYVNVLSRTATDEPKWTPLYLDAQGLGLLSALVVPIFNRTSGLRGKQLGVIGTDILLDEIMSKIPQYQLGAGGYAFSITNNGLIFFHPLFREEEGVQLKKSLDVYLVEVEHRFDEATFIDKLAKEMIDRNKGFMPQNFEKSDVVVKYDDKFRIARRKLKYYYDHITNTSFSVAIVMTDYGLKGLSVTNDTFRDDIKPVSKKYNISIADAWPYCNDTVKNWEDLRRILEEKSNLAYCENKNLTNHVHADIKVINKWKPVLREKVGISSVFVGTSSGLTFSMSKGNDIIIFNTSIKQRYFERAADHYEKQTIVFYASSKYEVHASKAVVVGTTKTVWGVAGIHISSFALQENLTKIAKKYSTDPDTFCYLIDENGYIVVSSQGNRSGEFLGSVEGSVMKDLIEKKVYMGYNFTDVQATCYPGSDKSSSSIKILDPLYALVRYVKWWTQTVALSLIQYSLYSIMTATKQVKAEEESETSTACFKSMTLYIRADDGTGPTNWEVRQSGGCKTSYKWHLVKDTNLMLIIVQRKNSTFCKDLEKMKDEATKDDYEGSPCEVVNHYRREPKELGSCVPRSDEIEECSSGILPLPSLILVFLFQIMFVVLTN